MVNGSSFRKGEPGSDVIALTVHAGGLVACRSCHFSRQTRALDRLRAFLNAVLIAAPMSCDHLTRPALCKHTPKYKDQYTYQTHTRVRCALFQCHENLNISRVSYSELLFNHSFKTDSGEGISQTFSLSPHTPLFQLISTHSDHLWDVNCCEAAERRISASRCPAHWWGGEEARGSVRYWYESCDLRNHLLLLSSNNTHVFRHTRTLSTTCMKENRI